MKGSRHSRMVRIWSVLAALALVGGCSGSEEGSPAPADPSAIRQQLSQLSEQAAQKGFDRQAEMLADGVVTEAEYREATFTFVECLESNGVAYSDFVRYDTLTSFRWDLIPLVEESGMTVDEVMALMDSCQEEHQLDVQLGWNIQDRGEFREGVRDDLRACLAEAGVELEEVPGTLDELLAAVGDDERGSTTRCMGEVEADLGTSPP